MGEEKMKAAKAQGAPQDFSFTPNAEYKERLQLFEDINSSKFSPDTIQDRIDAGQGERDLKQKEQTLRNSTNDFMNNIMRKIDAPMNRQGLGFTGIFTEAEYDQLFHSKDLDKRAFYLDDKNKLIGNPNVIDTLAKTAVDRTIYRIKNVFPKTIDNPLGAVDGAIKALENQIRNGALKGTELQMTEAYLKHLRTERKGVAPRVNPTAIHAPLPPPEKTSTNVQRAKSSVKAGI